MFERFEVVEIEATDGTALGIEADVTDHEAVTSMVAGSSRLGLGRCPGRECGRRSWSPMDTKASTVDPALLQVVVEMNLFGTVYKCNAVAPIMKQQRSGTIITVSSVAGTAPSAEGGEARILCCASRGTEGAFHIMRKSGVKQV